MLSLVRGYTQSLTRFTPEMSAYVDVGPRHNGAAAQYGVERQCSSSVSGHEHEQVESERLTYRNRTSENARAPGRM